MLQDGAQLLLRGGLIDARVGLEFDVKFTSMRAPGVFAQFRAPDLLFDALHIGQCKYLCADAPADTSTSRRARCPGIRARDLHDEMPFPKIGHECAAQEGQDGAGADHQRNQYRQSQFKMRTDAVYGRLLP